jgi:hypothetical protein
MRCFIAVSCTTQARQAARNLFLLFFWASQLATVGWWIKHITQVSCYAATKQVVPLRLGSLAVETILRSAGTVGSFLI